jgi:hypothetical protein
MGIVARALMQRATSEVCDAPVGSLNAAESGLKRPLWVIEELAVIALRRC